jgi:aldose 1-epimerase
MPGGRGEFCFKSRSGEDIYLFTLRNETVEISISNYGAIVTSFKVKLDDRFTNDIVLGFEKVEDYCSDGYLASCPYFGAVVGRYANRIKDGRFRIDDQFYSLTQNKGNDHLHGGSIGFDRRVWTCDHYCGSELVLSRHSPDGEEGYPGNLDTTIRFRLNESNEFSYEFFATTDRPTAVNLAHHSYFNLLNGRASIGGHLVRINGDHILEQDNNHVATGRLVPVQETAYDFRDRKPVDKDKLTEGYDQTFVLNKTHTDPVSGLPFAAGVYVSDFDLGLEVFTTEPVVHFYSGRWIPDLEGKNGARYGPFSGLCFETHKHPNAINIPGFPNTVLRPGETYHTKTMYRVVRTGC